MPANVENMLYVGRTPWHGLGVKLDNPPTVAEAIRLAGLDWEVVLEDLQLTSDGRAVRHKATVRATDKSILGVVGPRYVPLQNADAFKWFEPFLESGEVSINTAGSLEDGKRVWVLAKINRDPCEIAKDDPVEKYILLSNSHDGTLAVRVGFTPVRIVCVNSLAMAHSDSASKLIRVRHTASAKQTLDDIRQTMDAANQEFEATADLYRKLARTPITGRDLEKYVKKAVGFEEQENGKLATRSQNVLDGIIRNYQEQNDVMGGLLFGSRVHEQATAAAEIATGAQVMDLILEGFESGRGADLPNAKGTYWQAYNAVTEYLSYERGRNDSSRLNALWFGEGANMNERALDLALTMAN